MVCKIVCEEVEKGKDRGFFGILWDYGYLILLRVFWK